MKGQLSFDYYFSLIVFVMFVTFLFFKLITFFPFYSSEVLDHRIRSEAYQVSELLVNDVGYPGNWHADASSAQRLGLSDETKNKTNSLSLAKAAAFNTMCGDYSKIVQLLDIKDGFWVTLTKTTANPPQAVILCSPQDTGGKVRANISRIVAFDDGTYGELKVSVWKK